MCFLTRIVLRHITNETNSYSDVKMKLNRYTSVSDVLHFYIYYMHMNAFQNKMTVKVNAFVNAMYNQ